MDIFEQIILILCQLLDSKGASEREKFWQKANFDTILLLCT